jgi:hypothetical protein
MRSQSRQPRPASSQEEQPANNLDLKAGLLPTAELKAARGALGIRADGFERLKEWLANYRLPKPENDSIVRVRDGILPEQVEGVAKRILEGWNNTPLATWEAYKGVPLNEWKYSKFYVIAFPILSELKIKDLNAISIFLPRIFEALTGNPLASFSGKDGV